MANTPLRVNGMDQICFNTFLYKARNLVERFASKAGQFRRVHH